jgi:ABC-type sugar transport system substrate-binding protein
VQPSKLFRASAACLLLAAAACSDRANTTADAPKAPRVAVVVSTLNNPWFVVLADAAREEAERRGYRVTVFDSQNDAAKEAAHFENIIASGYQGVLLNATDAEGSVANVKKARDRSIPVFTMDREINSQDAAVSQILSDNYAGAVAVGEDFIEQLDGKGSYVELLGLVSDNNTWNRSRGFHSVVDRFPDLKMVSQQSAEFDRSKALEVMESVLQGNRRIDAVFCGNDAMALGAYQALAAAGIADRVKVFGFDGSDDALQAIRDGKIAATAMQYPKVMAETAAEYVDRYINGDRGLPQRVPVAVHLITKANIEQFPPNESAKAN